MHGRASAGKLLQGRHALEGRMAPSPSLANIGQHHLHTRIPPQHRLPPRHYAEMATDTTAQASKQPMTAPELIAYVKNELDADEERQAKVSAASAGELPRESQTGSTLDLSHRNLNVLPVEVVILIKDKVERYIPERVDGRAGAACAAADCLQTRTLAQSAHCFANRNRPMRSASLFKSTVEQAEALSRSGTMKKPFLDVCTAADDLQVLTLAKLEILDISKNSIDEIPEDIKKMTNLKFLAVARNQIKRLPYALGEMNLVKLKFDENPIEFPPPEALKPSADRANPAIESEKDKDMCQQVKRYMKTAAMRERLKTSSDDDVRYVAQATSP